MLAVLMASSNAGCQDRPEIASTVQHAVNTGAQGALATRLEARPTPQPSQVTPPPSAPSVDLSATPPTGHIEGSGAQARLVIDADASHVAPSTARSGSQFAATWGDRDNQTVRFAAYDANGHVVGASQRVHQAVEGEETASASALVPVGNEGFAVAWIDGENGRVRFVRLDASGARRGSPTIIHEGLESPQTTRLVWNGREFAVAIGLWHGVYFARVSAQGARLGDGAVVAEGESVRSIDDLRSEGSAFGLSWTEEHNGQPIQVRQRMSGAGREAAPVVGSRRSTRRAM